MGYYDQNTFTIGTRVGAVATRNGGALQLCTQPNNKVQGYISYFEMLQGFDRSRSNTLLKGIWPRKDEIQVALQTWYESFSPVCEELQSKHQAN